MPIVIVTMNRTGPVFVGLLTAGRPVPLPVPLKIDFPG